MNAGHEPARHIDRGAGETVLVVADEPGIRKATRRMLERNGFAVIEAGPAAEALRVVDAHGPVDAIVSDVVMPGGSRPSLVDEVLRRHPATAVVLVSGCDGHQGSAQEARASLPKPFTGPCRSQRIARRLLPGCYRAARRTAGC